MINDSIDFILEDGQIALIILDGFRVSLEAQATLICEDRNDVSSSRLANISRPVIFKHSTMTRGDVSFMAFLDLYIAFEESTHPSA